MKLETQKKKIAALFTIHDSGFKIHGLGFTLLETLAALSILTFAILGPFSLAVFSIRSSGSSENQFTAFYLAQEAMEYIRNRRDSNALQGASNWLASLVNCRSANGCYVDVTLPDGDSASVVTCTAGVCPKLRYNSAAGVYSYSVGDPETIFTRKVQLDRIEDYEEKVQVIISWSERGVSKSFTIEEDIFDWP